MIGELPTSLLIGGKQYKIRSDYRIILNICQAFNDPDLNEQEKCYVCVKCLYEDCAYIPREHIQEAVEKAYWFVGGGDSHQSNVPQVQTIDWEQDEKIIFNAVNKSAGYEIRSCPYMHWWTFLGFFTEMGDCQCNLIMSLRQKIGEGKKLEKWEKDYYNKNKNLVDIKHKLTKEEQEELDFVNSIV